MTYGCTACDDTSRLLGYKCTHCRPSDCPGCGHPWGEHRYHHHTPPCTDGVCPECEWCTT